MIQLYDQVCRETHATPIRFLNTRIKLSIKKNGIKIYQQLLKIKYHFIDQQINGKQQLIKS